MRKKKRQQRWRAKCAHRKPDTLNKNGRIEPFVCLCWCDAVKCSSRPYERMSSVLVHVRDGQCKSQYLRSNEKSVVVLVLVQMLSWYIRTWLDYISIGLRFTCTHYDRSVCEDTPPYGGKHRLPNSNLHVIHSQRLFSLSMCIAQTHNITIIHFIFIWLRGANVHRHRRKQ